MIARGIPDAQVEVRDYTGGGDHFEALVVSPSFEGKGLMGPGSTCLSGAGRRDARAGACAHAARRCSTGAVSEPEVEKSNGGHNRKNRIGSQRKQGHDFHEGQPQLAAMRILSAATVAIFEQLGVPFATADVLSDPELRNADEELQQLADDSAGFYRRQVRRRLRYYSRAARDRRARADSEGGIRGTAHQ